MTSYFRWVLTSVLLILSLSADHASAQSSQKNDKKYEPLIVDFSDGHTIELVGMTYNTLQVDSGWRPDGSPMKGEEHFPSKILMEGDSWKINKSGNELLPPDGDTFDFLFRWRGLKDQPSLKFEVPFSSEHYYQEKIQEPFKLRVCGKLRDAMHEGTSQSLPENTIRVGFSDVSWGRWMRINPDATIPEPLKPDELHASTYQLIEVVGLGTPITSAPGIQPIKIRQPSEFKNPKDEWHHYEFEIRALDSAGSKYSVSSLSGRHDGNHYVKSEYGMTQEIPHGRNFSHFEVRMRPYKYWVTFDRVALKPGELTEPGFTARMWP